MTEDKRSPLHDQQLALGAVFEWEDGWPWALTVGDTGENEYEAIRSAAGLWDLFSTTKYEVTGPDAGRLIQRRCTNDVQAMSPGQVRYGAFVNPDGLMVDDGNVYKFSDEKYWVMINTDGLEGWFRETAVDLDARIAFRTEELPMIGVQGPTSRDLLSTLTDANIGMLRWFQFIPELATVAGRPAYILRTGFSGDLGFEVVTDPESAPVIFDALIAAGGKPFGLEAVEMARIEAGLVIIGFDYQPGETSPYDLSMDKFIKSGTECVGVQALAEYGANPPKRFKTLSIEGDAPELGTAVESGDQKVGTVTSAITTPRVGTVALAILDADAATDGTIHEVAGAKATTGPLSIFDPEKKRPRV